MAEKSKGTVITAMADNVGTVRIAVNRIHGAIHNIEQHDNSFGFRNGLLKAILYASCLNRVVIQRPRLNGLSNRL